MPGVGIEGGLVRQRQHFPAVGIEHDQRTRCRAVALHRGFEFAVGEVLQAQVESEFDIAAELRRAQVVQIPDIVQILYRAAATISQYAFGTWRAGQVLVVGQLHALLAHIVNVRTTHKVGRSLPGRVETVIFAPDPHAVDLRLGHAADHVWRQPPSQVGETLGPRTVTLFDNLGGLVQDVREALQVRRRQRGLLGVHPGVAHGGADRQRLAVAVEDHAAVNRNRDLANRTRLALLLQEIPFGDRQIACSTGEAYESDQEHQDDGTVATSRRVTRPG